MLIIKKRNKRKLVSLFVLGVNMDIMCYQGQYINTLKLTENPPRHKKDLPAYTPTDLRY